MSSGQTRLRLTLLIIGLALIEGLIKNFLAAFPLTEVFALQGTALGGYLAAKSTTNVKEARYANSNTETK